MRTKCLVLKSEEFDPKKPIELLYYSFDSTLEGWDSLNDQYCIPSDWDNIELIVRDYGSPKLDLMLVYNGIDRTKGVLALGHWNDGVV